MKHDVLTAAMIERAKQKAKQKAFFERQKQEYEKNEQQERQRISNVCKWNGNLSTLHNRP